MTFNPSSTQKTIQGFWITQGPEKESLFDEISVSPAAPPGLDQVGTYAGWSGNFTWNGNDSPQDTQIFSDALSGVNLNTPFPNSPTGRNLKMIANIIGARGPLSMNRQIFYLVRGGWDHHTEVLDSQDALFSEIDPAIGAFWDALVEMGLEDQVTLFTASDFGRTLTTNGRGSDHAWGGNQCVVGGAVQGGKIAGAYPTLSTGTNLDVGRGRLLPTSSVDHYAAELASWFGVSGSDMPTVLPNVRNFFDPISTPRPLGFMR